LHEAVRGGLRTLGTYAIILAERRFGIDLSKAWLDVCSGSEAPAEDHGSSTLSRWTSMTSGAIEG
jgi:hypothetical protein